MRKHKDAPAVKKQGTRKETVGRLAAKPLTVAIASPGWTRPDGSRNFLGLPSEIGIVSRGMLTLLKPARMILAGACLAAAVGAWGRSGPIHRTLRPLAMGNAFV